MTSDFETTQTQAGVRRSPLRASQPASIERSAADAALDSRAGRDDIASLLDGSDRGSAATIARRLQQERGNAWLADRLDPAARIRARSGQGSPLDRLQRRQLERGLGANLDGVRIHSDSEAETLTGALGAAAFTAGSDIYLDTTLVQPGSETGDSILRHEVAHAVQQQRGEAAGTPVLDGSLSLSTPGDDLEMAATRSADLVASGAAAADATPSRSAPGAALAGSALTVQRFSLGDLLGAGQPAASGGGSEELLGGLGTAIGGLTGGAAGTAVGAAGTLVGDATAGAVGGAGGAASAVGDLAGGAEGLAGGAASAVGELAGGTGGLLDSVGSAVGNLAGGTEGAVGDAAAEVGALTGGAAGAAMGALGEASGMLGAATGSAVGAGEGLLGGAGSAVGDLVGGLADTGQAIGGAAAQGAGDLVDGVDGMLGGLF